MSRAKRTEENRQSILDAGIELLTEQGYHGTGLKQILDAVKIPKGSFYYYFENKEQFVAEVLNHYMTKMRGDIDALMAQGGSPMTKLKRLTQVAFDRDSGQYRGCLIANLSAEMGSQSPACSAVMTEGWARWQARLTTLVRDGQACGEVRTDIDAGVLGRLYLDRWEGGMIRMRVEQDMETFRQEMHLMLDVIFKG